MYVCIHVVLHPRRRLRGAPDQDHVQAQVELGLATSTTYKKKNHCLKRNVCIYIYIYIYIKDSPNNGFLLKWEKNINIAKQISNKTKT